MASTGIIRSIGGIQFEVTVSEQHHDDITITTHPVEIGAPITDHFFKMPVLLTVKAASSSSYVDSDDLSSYYNQLLAMQVSGNLLSVQTGKRLYQNMLIKSLVVETDQTRENVLDFTAQLQEVIMVSTLQTTMPPSANQANPSQTSATPNTGTKSTISYSGTLPAYG